jgi:hypothetical protein
LKMVSLKSHGEHAVHNHRRKAGFLGKVLIQVNGIIITRRTGIVPKLLAGDGLFFKGCNACPTLSKPLLRPSGILTH